MSCTYCDGSTQTPLEPLREVLYSQAGVSHYAPLVSIKDDRKAISVTTKACNAKAPFLFPINFCPFCGVKL